MSDAEANQLSNELAGIERIDQQVPLARNFMRQLIADAQARRQATPGGGQTAGKR
jgi:hypothetical protein